MKHAFLLLAALTAALCLSRTSAQTPPSPPLTGKIAHVTILGIKNIPVDTVRAVLTLHPGDAYTPEAAAKDTAAIKGMGVFNAATEAATADPAGGVNVTYTVLENPVIQTIKFTTNAADGKPSVPFSEMLAQMKTQPGQVLNTNVLVKDLDNLFNHTDGYAFKQGRIIDVSSDINIDPKTGTVTIPLVECYIQSIQITGNSRVKTEDILAQIHTKIGGIYDGNTLNADMGAIYQTGSFRAINVTLASAGPGKVAVTIPVVEQPAATGVLDERQGKIIPFLYDPLIDPFPIVQVSVNDKLPLPFIIDTGTSQALSLDFWAAKALGITASGPIHKNSDDISYQEAPVQGVVLEGLNRRNDFAFNTQKAVVLDLHVLTDALPGQHIAGIIGLAMLVPVTSRFDFAAKTLTIFSQPHAPLQFSGGTSLPLRGTAGGIFQVRATLAPSTYADLILDTGSTSTQLPLSTLSSLHPSALAYSSISRIYGDYVCPELRLPEINLGALTVANLVITVLPSQVGPSLGLDVLTGYRVTLDGPNGQLLLEPSIQSRRYPIGRSGLDIKQVNKGWFVSKLKAGLPAQNAGLRVGDELVMVGGAGVQGFSLPQVGRELSGLAGVPVQVSVRRKGKVVALTWVPVNEFNPTHSVIDGLSIMKIPKGTAWLVEDVLQGCPGSRAGLQVGDKITHINGHSVADAPTESFEEAEEPASALFEIERIGVAKPFTVQLSVPK